MPGGHAAHVGGGGGYCVSLASLPPSLPLRVVTRYAVPPPEGEGKCEPANPLPLPLPLSPSLPTLFPTQSLFYDLNSRIHILARAN